MKDLAYTKSCMERLLHNLKEKECAYITLTFDYEQPPYVRQIALEKDRLIEWLEVTL